MTSIESLTDIERQLLVQLVTSAYMAVRIIEGADVQTKELYDILRKISGVDKQIIIRN